MKNLFLAGLRSGGLRDIITVLLLRLRRRCGSVSVWRRERSWSRSTFAVTLERSVTEDVQDLNQFLSKSVANTENSSSVVMVVKVSLWRKSSGKGKKMKYIDESQLEELFQQFKEHKDLIRLVGDALKLQRIYTDTEWVNWIEKGTGLAITQTEWRNRKKEISSKDLQERKKSLEEK
jgi:hypothetical protein